jgi:hypothetical protein
VERLNFPELKDEFQFDQQKKLIFDIVRKKFIPLTPEEWVRQHCVCFLNQYLDIPLGRMAIERSLNFNGLTKRFDIVTFSSSGTPQLLIECKAPEIPLSQKTLIQAGVYNTKLDTPFIWLTNGFQHVWLKKENSNYDLISFPLKPDELF